MHNPSTFSSTWQELFSEQLPPEIIERYAQVYQEKRAKRHRELPSTIAKEDRVEFLLENRGLWVLAAISDAQEINCEALAKQLDMTLWRVREHVRRFRAWGLLKVNQIGEARVDWARVQKVEI